MFQKIAQSFRNFADLKPWQKAMWIILVIATVVFLLVYPELTVKAFTMVGDLFESMMPKVEISASFIKDVPVGEMFSLNVTKGFHFPQISFDDAQSAVATLDISLTFVVVVVLVAVLGILLSAYSPAVAYFCVVVLTVVAIVCAPVVIGIYDHLIAVDIRPSLAKTVFGVITVLVTSAIVLIGFVGDNRLKAQENDSSSTEKKKSPLRTAIGESLSLGIIGYGIMIALVLIFVRPSDIFYYVCVGILAFTSFFNVSYFSDQLKKKRAGN